MKHSCPVLSASRVNRQCVCEPETLIEQLYGTAFSLEWALEGFSLYTEQPRVYNCHVQNNNKTPTDNIPTLDNIPDHTPWHHSPWPHPLTPPLDNISWPRMYIARQVSALYSMLWVHEPPIGVSTCNHDNLSDLLSKNLANTTFEKNPFKVRSHSSYPSPCHGAYFKVISCPVAEIQLETYAKLLSVYKCIFSSWRSMTSAI